MHRVRLLVIFSSLLVVILLLSMFGTGCTQQQQEKPTITLMEGNWTSVLVLTEILDQIISELGYPVERTYGYGPIIWAAMDKGEIDIAPEIWFPAREPEIKPFLDKGNIELAGVIFTGGNGWFVPRFVVEGDPARGIEPMAPDLKTILDLKKYWQLFENPEKPGLGEVVGGSPGWIMPTRWIILGYDLPLWESNQTEPIFCARMIAADKKGEPLLLYIWFPHWLLSHVDMIKLEAVDPCRSDAIDYDKAPVPVKTGWDIYYIYKVVRVELAETAPDVYRLVHNMVVSEDEINALMLRVDVEEEEISAVAADWISQNQDKIDQWLAK